MAELDPTSWTCSSNDALHVSIAEPRGAFTFKPKFTYPIFGNAEQIFGYKGLRIDLAFNCKSLKPFLNYRYKSKTAENAKDINKEILPFLPKDDVVIKDEMKWLDAVDKEDFKIPGTFIKEYKVRGDTDNTFKIYKFNIVKDEAGRKLHRRMQIFVLLYIEAGSYIDEKDPAWDVYCIYKCPKDGSTETFVGYMTTYGYWYYPGHLIYDSKASSLWRKKISQFVILPPFQGRRHGQHLYETVVDEWLQDPSVKQMTVEDPSEAFDDLRDRCDMERLLFQHYFLKNLKKLPVTDEWMEATCKTEKMEKRQFARCVEMGLLYTLRQQQQEGKVSGIENLDQKEIRLQIKRRLYQKNRDALTEMQKPEMRDKLQTAYQRIRDDYMRILMRIKNTTKAVINKRSGDSEESASKAVKTK